MQYTGERAIPWNPAVGHVMDLHAQRYAWALQFCHGQRVVDLGCGTGYGSFMLSWVAREALGIDCSVLAVDFARQRFNADNLDYRTGDVRAPLPEADVYVAFEVLEHLDRPDDLASAIDGVLIWSVPTYDGSAFHKHVYQPKVAIDAFGGDIWYQSKAGYIVPQASAQFKPRNVLGVRA